MYEDKTLVCKDCGNEFVFTAGEQEFYAEKASLTSHRDAKNAVTKESTHRVNITMLYVLLAARNVKFLLHQAVTALFTAVNVSLKCRKSNSKTSKILLSRNRVGMYRLCFYIVYLIFEKVLDITLVLW